MRESDQQLGKPLRAYRDTKANIVGLGLGAGDEGCIAYATDTNEFGAFDGAAWAWSIHDLLGTRHGDTTTDAVTRGSMITGNATPAWDELAYPGTAYHLQTSAADIFWGQNIVMADNAWIGIDALAERIVFDTAGDITVMGANFGVGTPAPSTLGHLKGAAAALTIEDTTNALAWRFTAANFRLAIDPVSGATRDIVLINSGAGNIELGLGRIPTCALEIDFATEALGFVDAGSAGATEQDWIEVKVGGVQGYIRVFAAK